MKRRLRLSLLLSAALPLAAFAQVQGDAGVGATLLIDPAAPGALAHVHPTYGADAQASYTNEQAALIVTIQPGECAWPGILVQNRTGSSWDLSNYGHVEAKITNLGEENVTPILRVDNPRPAQGDPNVFNAEQATIAPGASTVLKVYFGYSYQRPGYALNVTDVSRVMLSMGKVTGKPVRLKVEQWQAAGFPGEKPGENPKEARRKPGADGVLYRAGAAAPSPVAPETVARCAGMGGGYAAFDAAQKLAVMTVKGEGSKAMLMPAPAGYWDFSAATRAFVTVRNAGKTAAVPRLCLESVGGPTDPYGPARPLVPGETATIEIPFAAAVPWAGEEDPAQLGEVGRVYNRKPGTGTDYRAHKTTGLTLLGSAATAGGASFAILEIRGATADPRKPAWLGTRPPVPGAWKPTLQEEFDGPLNHKIWNVYWFNWTSPLVHFTTNNIFTQDGKLILRVSKDYGHHNDDPKDKATPYATGWGDTFGKWTQRYGYFEIRCKLPTQKHIWPAFWTMPDRGRGVAEAPGYGVPFADWPGFRKRYSNFDGGMEFDIVEPQSIWGPHRFNVACHWGDYGKGHHRLGTSAIYVDTDEEGFFTMGMLWLPGHVSFWEHGRKFWEWNSPRVASVQMMLHLQNMLGGWEYDALDDRELPADFVIDYIRVWQREDLATPEDGFKPNIGGLDGRYPQWIEE